MDFRDATDQLLAQGVTLSEIADVLDVAHNTVARARMDPDSPNARRPPGRWKPRLARLARKRGTALVGLADELEREG